MNTKKANLIVNNGLPLISIIVPLYNKSLTIGRCLNSIRQQKFQDFEIIVVDDGSSDSSAEIAKKFLNERDLLICQNNSGVSSARNIGIKKANGIYIAFLDADDEWEPDYLKAIVTLAKRYPQAGILATGYRMRFSKGRAVEVTLRGSDENLTTQVNDYFKRSKGGAFIWTGCITIPRKIFDVVGIFRQFNPNIMGEDIDLWTRISLLYPVAYDKRILSNYYRDSPGQYTRCKRNFSNYPIGYPKFITSLRNLLSQNIIDSNCQKDILAYINHWLLYYACNIAIQGNHDKLIYYLKEAFPMPPFPYWVQVARMPLGRYVLKLIAFIHKISSSRMFLHLRGGERLSHGVIQRLV